MKKLVIYVVFGQQYFANKHIIIIGSMYHSPNSKFDNIDINVISNQMDIIRNRYKNKNKKIIFHLNGDWNAKHDLWGSTTCDDRGMKLLNWMAKHNLVTTNDGSPTHKHKVSGKEDAIDLTITSIESKKNVVRWKIYKDLTTAYDFSDHYLMESLINLNPVVIDNPDKITWDFDQMLIKDFNNEMEKKMIKWKLYYDTMNMEKKNVNKLVEYFQLLFVQCGIKIFGFKYYNSKNFNTLSKKVIKLMNNKKIVSNKLSHLIRQLKKKSKYRYKSVKDLFKSNIPKYIKKYWKSLKRKINKLNKKIYKSKEDTIISSTKKMEKLINQKVLKMINYFGICQIN